MTSILRTQMAKLKKTPMIPSLLGEGLDEANRRNHFKLSIDQNNN